MLVSRIGSGKSKTCKVDTDVKPYVYLIRNHAIVTKPIGQ
jgi:hypothetical protein